MDWRQFIVELVKALAWPTSLVIALLLFRRQILALAPEIKKLRYRSFEIEFKESLRQAQAALQAEPQPHPQPAGERETRLSHLAELASLAPRAAILEGWLEVESAAAAALERRRGLVPKATRVFPSRLGDELQRAEILSPRLREVYDQLRMLRNKAVHVSDAAFDPDEVSEYLFLAGSLVRHLQGM